MIYQFPQSLETKNNENESPLTIAYQYCKDTNVIWLLLIYGPEAVNTLTTRESSYSSHTETKTIGGF